MVDFLLSGIVLSLGMMISAFVGSIILSNLFSGIFLMRKLKEDNVIKNSNYGIYIISILFWVFIFYLLNSLFTSFIKFETVWSFGVVIGFIFSLNTLSYNNLENNKREFYNRNASLFKKDSEEITHKLRSLMEISNIDYDKVNNNFKLLNEIIKQSEVLEKHDYDEDYYKLVSYMYILIWNHMEIIKANEDDIRTSIVLTDYFQMISDDLTDNKYKNEDIILRIFCEDVIPLFRLAWHRAESLDVQETNYVFGFIIGYMTPRFLYSVFNIQKDEFETTYDDVTEKVGNLFFDIFDEGII